jgi:uncharacterized membrane protein
MKPDTQRRIIFLDLMRALAVIMMVQGHTIDTFLSDQFRTHDSVVYNIWFTIRGFTAPIFMFTSGVAFTYLFRLNKSPFIENPRVKKGIYRFITLVLIGYLLRYPTPRMVDFSLVDHYQWLTFFNVDALHLIGFGILFILVLGYFGEKYKITDTKIFTIGAAFFFISFFFTEKINWANFLPIPFAGYFYSGTGSYFPLFPWSGYVISGAILGSYLANNPGSFESKNFSLQLFKIGVALLIICVGINILQYFLYGQKEFWTDNTALIFYRLGFIILLNSLMSFISIKLKNIPDIIKLVGKNTLLIYVLHVIILYGSAWIPGFGMFWPKTLGIPLSILAAVLLIAVMFIIVSIFEKIKTYKRRKILAAEI